VRAVAHDVRRASDGGAQHLLRALRARRLSERKGNEGGGRIAIVY
jgi:hypothetical protein